MHRCWALRYIIAENDIRPTLTNHGRASRRLRKTENEVCNIEMQTVKRAKLGRRLRFYQGAMDTLALRRGEHYGNLPPCYIVFICLHDPFNAGLPVYTLNVKCQENTSVETDHGFTWVVLAASAWDRLLGTPAKPATLYFYRRSGRRSVRHETSRRRKGSERRRSIRRKEKMALLTFEGRHGSRDACSGRPGRPRTLRRACSRKTGERPRARKAHGRRSKGARLREQQRVLEGAKAHASRKDLERLKSTSPSRQRKAGTG